MIGWELRGESEQWLPLLPALLADVFGPFRSHALSEAVCFSQQVCCFRSGYE